MNPQRTVRRYRRPWESSQRTPVLQVPHRSKGVPVVTRGEGAYIWDNRGRKILDGLSGLFVVQVGHGREELAELATANGLVDLVIPRGGEGLKKALEAVATVPVRASGRELRTWRFASRPSASPRLRSASGPWPAPGISPCITASSPSSSGSPSTCGCGGGGVPRGPFPNRGAPPGTQYLRITPTTIPWMVTSFS